MIDSVTARLAASGGDRPVAIALHCSGASGREWRHLAQSLEPKFTVIAPDLIGCGGTPHWGGGPRFSLTDEARSIVAAMDAVPQPVHLVGHSYGGAVALRAAIERPHRVASLSLYEPTAFHVLRSVGFGGNRALMEIQSVASAVTQAVACGADAAAARRFVDYWNGHGAFAALKPEAQDELVRYIPKAVLDFQALLSERTPLVAYRRLRAPLCILSGDRSPEPALLVAQRLARAINPGALRVVEGAGHMGPFSHAALVARQIADHIVAAGTSAGVPADGSAQWDWAA
ncbi:MAG: alpha/beta hydrolase [Alphaproteobacteria bacterium]|nr:alpha/beta hydrolase [Alphaproteobacteria bacterium]